MLSLIENLPVDLVGANVLVYLDIRDIVMLERGCGSKKSHQQFLSWAPYSPAVVLPSSSYKSITTLNWFAKRQCRIESAIIRLPGDNPGLQVENLQVDNFDLQIYSNTGIEEFIKPLTDRNLGYKVKTIYVDGNQNREVMEKLSVCTGKVTLLHISQSSNCMEWLTADILSKWKLTDINMEGETVTALLVSLIVQTCSELTSIKLYSDNIDDSAVIAIAQHCSKLEALIITSSVSNITYVSLLTLSEQGLPLKVLDVSCIPNIPTTDIARRCSHALSRIRYLNTGYFNKNGQDATILIPYMTGLTSVAVRSNTDTYIPMLTQHCHKLTNIDVDAVIECRVEDILSLWRANPLLQRFGYYAKCGITDTTLIELIHFCPHLHTLRFPYITDLTDIGILAISEQCPHLEKLCIYYCNKVTEVAVLQLLQRCRKLTRLVVSSRSLSKETWTQLDSNTQKRVSRC